MPDVRLIDANALMKNIGKIPQLRGITYGRMKNAVEETPTIDATPVVHGRWESCYEDWRNQLEGNKCSICGFEYYGSFFNYCPDCGARMDAKEAEHGQES